MTLVKRLGLALRFSIKLTCGGKDGTGGKLRQLRMVFDEI